MGVIWVYSYSSCSYRMYLKTTKCRLVHHHVGNMYLRPLKFCFSLLCNSFICVSARTVYSKSFTSSVSTNQSPPRFHKKYSMFPKPTKTQRSTRKGYQKSSWWSNSIKTTHLTICWYAMEHWTSLHDQEGETCLGTTSISVTQRGQKE